MSSWGAVDWFSLMVGAFVGGFFKSRYWRLRRKAERRQLDLLDLAEAELEARRLSLDRRIEHLKQSLR